jgi:polyferredoxin
MGPVMIGSLLTWILPPAAGFFLFGQTLQFHSWAFVNFVVFAIQTLIYIGVLKGFNRRAALALREEIEALDAAGR